MSTRGGIAVRERNGPGDWTVREVDETGSTNAVLLAAADDGSAADRTALRADHQTAGRGRLDRRWDAPPAVNLLASLLFVDVSGDPVLLTQAVGCAAVAAVEAATGRDLSGVVGLKWPNDVLVDGHKLAGVLAQRSPRTGAIVVGIGLNLGWAPHGAASVFDSFGCAIQPSPFLDLLLSAVDDHLALDDPTAAYRDRLMTIGQEVRLELPGDRIVVGVATGVDERGRLVLDDGVSSQAYDVGDVVHLRRS